MARGVLILSAVTLSGCVIPVSLQQDQQQANYPPVLVSGTPVFGSDIIRAKSDGSSTAALVSPTIVAEDLDADNPRLMPETLTARLFRQDNGILTFLPGQEITLAPETLNPSRFDGQLPPTPWCLFTNFQTASLEIIVIVADRPFYAVGTPGHTPDEVQVESTDGGSVSYTASQSWRFLCQ
jgi:hypothetical protein